MAPEEKQEKRKPTYEELEKAAGALAARVIWALKFMDAPGSGLVGHPVEGPDGLVTQPWEEWFMDALDQIGFTVDRKAFYEQREAKKSRRRAPKAKKPSLQELKRG